LINDVGWGLYARCESIVSVTNGFEKKQLICSYCGLAVPLIGNCFKCKCGFNATWDEFRSSYKNKQLYAANALPVFNAFIMKFPKAKTYGEKLICIDTLIHSFHIKNSFHHELENNGIYDSNTEINRPCGANLIEGSLTEVILFLDKLSSNSENPNEKIKWKDVIKRANGGYILEKNENGNRDANEGMN
jgi:hypothetical protein